MSEIPQELIDQFVGVAHGDFTQVKALLAEAPALLNARASWGEYAIQAAAQTANLEIVEFLLARGAPLDICTTAVLGMTERVRAFLREEPALVHARGAHGLPLLYYPAICGNEPMAELLVSAGAEVNAAADGSATALHGAVMFGRDNMVRWLLFHGADPNPKNQDGKTPLQLALEGKHSELAQILRAAGGEA